MPCLAIFVMDLLCPALLYLALHCLARNFPAFPGLAWPCFA
ncbi:hypothetical protein CP061683_1503 [Chlamydia psittaci 06-1683]|nr:hypothetical protein CP061683_1503 [Chlamydia psittaci 06-1683]